MEHIQILLVSADCTQTLALFYTQEKQPPFVMSDY